MAQSTAVIQLKRLENSTNSAQAYLPSSGKSFFNLIVDILIMNV